MLLPSWLQLPTTTYNYQQRHTLPVQVDCEQYEATCTKYEVKAYPALLLFENGREVHVYNGRRDVETMLSFLVEEKKKSEPAPEKRDEL